MLLHEKPRPNGQASWYKEMRVENLRTTANFWSANRQGSSMRNLYEGTGSVIVEDRSTPFQSVPRVWLLLSPEEPNLIEGNSATSGTDLVFIMNQSILSGATVVTSCALEAEPFSAMLSPASVLDVVRTVFGLNISETADVFRITRQTVYQWMKLTDMEEIRSHDNRHRLRQIYAVAKLWQNLPQLKGRWLHALLPTDNTVLDLLKASEVGRDALLAAHHALSARTLDRLTEEGERATQAATALMGAFASLGAGRKVRKV